MASSSAWRAMTRRRFLAAALALTVPCRYDASATPGPSARGDRRRAATFVGYGLVNSWHTLDPAPFAGLLDQAGLTLTEIEYVPWLGDPGAGGRSTRTDVAAARRFVEAMRARDVTTLISVVNWNGAAQRAETTDWFRDRVDKIAHEIGPDRVLLLPVSEPDAAGKSVEWTELAYRLWPGRKVGNGPGGRGTPVVGGYDYVDWHHCDFDRMLDELGVTRPAVIANTDCGPILNPGPVRAARLTRRAVDHGNHLLIYDHRGTAPDEALIRAMAAEIQR